MAGVGGYETIERLQLESPVKIVALAEDDSPGSIERAVRLGALGVIGKRAPVCFLKEAILSVAEGVRWFDPTVRSSYELAASMRGRELSGSIDVLPPQEQELAELVSRGLRYRQIADGLDVSEHTVRNHLWHVFEKLRMGSRVALAVFWKRQ